MAIPNQAPDSTVTGFLQGDPAVLAPATLPGQIAPHQTLEDYLQQLVAGVAGLEETLVRPRWQDEPPNMPDYGTDWAAVGIIERRPIGPYGTILRHGEDEGYDELQRHEEFDLLCTFYGPHATDYASNIHDGMNIWQNRAALRLAGLAYVDAGAARLAPLKIKNRWLDRTDKTLVFRRIIRRSYPVLNILSAQVRVVTDQPSQYALGVSVNPPPP